MNTRRFHRLVGVLLFVWATFSSLAQPGSADGLIYKTSLSSVIKLGIDLQRALPPAYRDKVHVSPVSIETDVMPFIRLEEYPNTPKPLPMVFISVGFIDLVNNIAHAKAIDRVKKGYFRRYVLALANETGEHSLLDLPDLDNKKYWTDRVLNDQLSNFNSIVGTVLGINLAHYYLGHYHKYAARLHDAQGRSIPINLLLTPDEWDQALSLGVQNALSAGCMIEGVLPFFETFDRMPQRPAWAAYFVPEFARYKDIRDSLERLQHKFFTGRP